MNKTRFRVSPPPVCALLALPEAHFFHSGFCFSSAGTDQCVLPIPSPVLSVERREQNILAVLNQLSLFFLKKDISAILANTVQ